MDEYLVVLSKKANKVRDAIITIEDEELALIALDGLYSSYDAFVTTITASVGDLSFTEFKGLLRAHEKRHTRALEQSFPSANAAQFNTRSARSSPVICQICAKLGHLAIACFNRHNEQCYPTPPNPRRNKYRACQNPESTISNVNAG